MLPKRHWIHAMGRRIPEEVLQAVDELDTCPAQWSTRYIADRASRKTGFPVSQSTVSRRRRQRRREVVRAAVLAAPAVRKPEPPAIRHITSSDQGLGRDGNLCWKCGRPGHGLPGGLIWGRCPEHSGGRVWTYMYWGLCDIPEGEAPVPEGGLGPDVDEWAWREGGAPGEEVA
jgi:hypothetical protein